MTELAEAQFQFSTRSHQKGVSKSSAFKSPQRPSAASVPDTSRDTESEMEISIPSDVTHQPSSTSPKRRQPPVATTTTSADPVLDQFQQMRSMISTFLGACQTPHEVQDSRSATISTLRLNTLKRVFNLQE